MKAEEQVEDLVLPCSTHQARVSQQTLETLGVESVDRVLRGQKADMSVSVEDKQEKSNDRKTRGPTMWCRRPFLSCCLKAWQKLCTGLSSLWAWGPRKSRTSSRLFREEWDSGPGPGGPGSTSMGLEMQRML